MSDRVASKKVKCAVYIKANRKMSNVKIGLLTILTRQLAGEMGTANPMEGANSIHLVARTSRGVSTFDPHALQRPIILAATAALEKVEIFQVEIGWS